MIRSGAKLLLGTNTIKQTTGSNYDMNDKEMVITHMQARRQMPGGSYLQFPTVVGDHERPHSHG